MLIKKKKSSETEEPLQHDKRLIAKIQPQAGITFNDEKLIKTGDGYEMILHIYRYPKYIDKFWLTQIVNIDNVVVTIDIETKDQQKVKQNINNSMSEQRTRIMYAKDMQERIEAEDEFSDLEQLYNEVSRMNQVMKLIHTSLWSSNVSTFATNLHSEERFSLPDNYIPRAGDIIFWGRTLRSLTAGQRDRRLPSFINRSVRPSCLHRCLRYRNRQSGFHRR